MSNILDISPNTYTVIIGTIYKEMHRKPCILSNYVGVLRDIRNNQLNYCSPEDYIVVEDSSGRIKIKKSDKIQPEKFITGSIMAFKGHVDQNGFFVVEDYCDAGYDPDHFLPLPDSV